MKDNTSDNCSLSSYNGNAKDYWNSVFSENNQQNWLQDKHDEINNFIHQAKNNDQDLILCVGAGDSLLIDELISQGFTNILANDISEVALGKIEDLLVSTNAVTYIADDLMAPKHLDNYKSQVNIWVDRATLHFFTSCKDKDTYFELLTSTVSPGGYALLGVFNKNNTAKCCGLDLQLWSKESLINRMSAFELVSAKTTTAVEKNGNQREYIYTLFKKK